MYLSETYEKKWQPVLEHPDLPKISDSYRRAVTATILENQERAMKEDRMKPVLEKIGLLEEIVKVVDGNRIHTRFSAFGFLQSIKKQCNERLSLSEKQMSALNKVYKKYKPKFDKKFDNNNKENK